METTEQMPEMHAENVKWLSSMNFYEEEIKIFNKRLEELVKVNTSHDLLAQVEHFQNQFIRQREVIDEMKHEFRIEEQSIEDTIGHRQGNVAGSVAPHHHEMKDRFETFEKIYKDLKTEFEAFVSRSL